MSAGIKGTTRYMAYEVFKAAENCSKESAQDMPLPYTKEVDVWAFGMTVYVRFTTRRNWVSEVLMRSRSKEFLT